MSKNCSFHVKASEKKKTVGKFFSEYFYLENSAECQDLYIELDY